MTWGVHNFLCHLHYGMPTHCGMQAGHLCGCANCLTPAHLMWMDSQAQQLCRQHHRLHGRGWQQVPAVKQVVEASMQLQAKACVGALPKAVPQAKGKAKGVPKARPSQV